MRFRFPCLFCLTNKKEFCIKGVVTDPLIPQVPGIFISSVALMIGG